MPSSVASWPVASAPMPAKVAWHNEISPAMPVMTVIDRKMIEKMTASLRQVDPHDVRVEEDPVEEDDTDDDAETARHPCQRVAALDRHERGRRRIDPGERVAHLPAVAQLR